MKKKLFLAAAALMCICAVGVTMKVNSDSKPDLLNLNIEALTTDEAVPIPCVKEKDSTCNFRTVDADGVECPSYVTNMKNA